MGLCGVDEVAAGQHEALGVGRDAPVEPRRIGIGADEQEQMPHRAVRFASVCAVAEGRPGERTLRIAVERGDLAADVQLDIGQRRDPIDQIARHRRFERPPHDEVQPRDVRREEHHRLPRGIAAADQGDLFARAELGLDRRRPIGNARALKGGEVWHVGAAIARARGDHHGAGAQLPAFGKKERQRRTLVLRRALEPLGAERDRDFGAELERLVERAAGERMPRNPGREAEIILDPVRLAGLATHRHFVEHDHREPLGRGIDRGGEPGGPRADDRDVIDRVRVELGDHAETGGDFAPARVAQHGAVRTDHQRQFGRQHAEPFDHVMPFAVDRRIEYEIGIAAARQEALQREQRLAVGVADQHRARAARLDQADAAQDQRAHHDLADLGRPDHQRAQMRRIERQRGASVVARDTAGKRGTTGKLADLSAELAGAVDRDRDFVAQPIATVDRDGALQDQPGRRMLVADREDRDARGKALRRAAGEAGRDLDLRRGEHREGLRLTRVDRAHAKAPVRMVPMRAPSRARAAGQASTARRAPTHVKVVAFPAR